MKLLIIGHSVVDHVHTSEGEVVAPGGIFYSTVGFNAVKHNDDQFYLLTSVSERDEKYFTRVFKNVNLDFADRFKTVPHVNLFIDGSAERKEHYENLVENLTINENINFSDFDGIYINMITGGDLLPEQIERIRSEFKGKVFLDVHTLSRGTGKEHHRYFRKIENYKSYLSNLDVVQVNESELKTITPYDVLSEILYEVFAIGIKLLIITKGENGVEAYSSEGDCFTLDAIEVNSINKIGCGDIFGSVFFYNYVKSNDVLKSLEIANTAAGLATAYKNTNDLLTLNYAVIKRHIEK